MIKYIKEKYGDYFCIGCAGYPETHLEATTAEDDLRHLKAKVDAGADLIITQLFFDTQIFIDFEKKCKEIGIDVPVIPGILPIQSYQGFMKMTSLAGTKIPEEILVELEEVKHDEHEVREYGVNLCVRMCKQLVQAGIKYLHFYTVNLEKSTVVVVDKLGIIRKHKHLPWK